MEDAELRARAWATVAEEQRLFGTCVPGARLLEGDGWVASIVPSGTDSPLLNAIVGLRDGVLGDALRQAEPALAAEGGRWGAWCDDGFGADRVALAAAGLRSELPPWTVMAAPMDELDLDGEIAGAPTRDMYLIGAVNDLAYGLDDGRLAEHFAPMPPDRVHGHRLDVDGRTVSVAAVTDHDGDAGVMFVATVPAARDQGLAAALLRGALRDARARGARTSSLLATAMGIPLYARLGYRDLGRAHLWER